MQVQEFCSDLKRPRLSNTAFTIISLLQFEDLIDYEPILIEVANHWFLDQAWQHRAKLITNATKTCPPSFERHQKLKDTQSWSSRNLSHRKPLAASVQTDQINNVIVFNFWKPKLVGLFWICHNCLSFRIYPGSSNSNWVALRPFWHVFIIKFWAARIYY